MLPVLLRQIAEGLSDPFRRRETTQVLADRRDDTEPPARVRSGHRRCKDVESFGERRRLVCETLECITARKAVAATEQGGVFRAHLVETGLTGTLAEIVMQAAQGCDAVDE